MVPGMRILTIIDPSNTSQPQPPSGGTKSYSLLSTFALVSNKLTANKESIKYLLGNKNGTCFLYCTCPAYIKLLL